LQKLVYSNFYNSTILICCICRWETKKQVGKMPEIWKNKNST